MSLRADFIGRWVVGPSVLDVGCAGHQPMPGSEYWVHGRLRSDFPDVWGIDVSEENVAALTGLGFRNLHVADAERFSLGRRFNTIVAGEIIEHLTNPGLFLERAREHLEPNGRLVLTTPFPFALFEIVYALTRFPRTCSNPQHTSWFCPQTLREMVQRCGYEVVHWELMEDYVTGDPTLSRRYRAFVWFIRTFRWLIPLRLRANRMMFVLGRRDA